MQVCHCTLPFYYCQYCSSNYSFESWVSNTPDLETENVIILPVYVRDLNPSLLTFLTTAPNTGPPEIPAP